MLRHSVLSPQSSSLGLLRGKQRNIGDFREVIVPIREDHNRLEVVGLLQRIIVAQHIFEIVPLALVNRRVNKLAALLIARKIGGGLIDIDTEVAVLFGIAWALLLEC